MIGWNSGIFYFSLQVHVILRIRSLEDISLRPLKIEKKNLIGEKQQNETKVKSFKGFFNSISCFEQFQFSLR